MLKFIVTIIFFVFLSPSYSLDQEYFLTLRNEKVNLRQGPSFDHPIKIFYKKDWVKIKQDISNWGKKDLWGDYDLLIGAYKNNLNTHKSYLKFREKRNSLRE